MGRFAVPSSFAAALRLLIHIQPYHALNALDRLIYPQIASEIRCGSIHNDVIYSQIGQYEFINTVEEIIESLYLFRCRGGALYIKKLFSIYSKATE